MGAEMVVNGPLGDRRYDIVVRDTNGKLQCLEVKSGTVGTEILESAKVQAELQAKLNRAQQNFDANPTRKNTDKLKFAARDLRNATRDGECLIKGCVPSGYFNHVK
ncbi:hypothetical protein [Pseudomonas trivialis]|uniref:hypothetical protein n=1 Tax=Pseudomonas trivialis TaxID=200450 RepID=UPI0020C824DA|nr:hypothetical protein [Pseudomonas trivialis]